MPDRFNPIIGDSNVYVDIDHLNVSTSRYFSITHNKGTEELFRVSEDGSISILDGVTAAPGTIAGRASLYVDIDGILKVKYGDGAVVSIGSPSAVDAHNDLDGLNVGDYLHLTAAEYADYNPTDWDTAYGWGDHAGLYAPIAGAHNRAHNLLDAADHTDVATYLSQALLTTSTPQFAKIGVGAAAGANAYDLFLAKIAANYAGFTLESYSTTAGHEGIFACKKSNSNVLGTLTATANGHNLGAFLFSGVSSSSAFAFGASLTVVQDGASGASAVPSNILLETYSATALNANQFVLHNDGFIGVGTATPVSLLELSSSTASPVLTISGLHASAYDPAISFRTDASPTQKAIMGIDSTDDSFRIEMGTGLLGARNDFVMDTSGRIGINISTTTFAQLAVVCAPTGAFSAVIGNITPTLSGDANFESRGFSGNLYTSYAGFTQSSALYGLDFTCAHNSAGTQAGDLYGIRINYGSITNAGAIITGIAAGLRIKSYAHAAVTTLADI
jgi:hypothetical protein